MAGIRHRVTGVNRATKTGRCSVCGPVNVSVGPRYKGQTYWRCSQARQPVELSRYRTVSGVAEAQRAARFLRMFGITLEDYDRLLAEQSGVCARCENPPGQKRLAVDHDHKTGKVRGLLCVPCNTYLGRLEANLLTLDADLMYLNAEVIARRLAEAAPITNW